MLRAIGVDSLDDLVRVPDAVALARRSRSTRSSARSRSRERFRRFAERTTAGGYTSFLGAGAYRHYVPPVDRRARDARRVPDLVHAVSGRGLARLPAGDLRVADLHLRCSPGWTSPTRRSTTARRRWPKARSWRSTRRAAKRCWSRAPCIRTIARCCARTATGWTSRSTSCRTAPTARPTLATLDAALADQRYAAVVVQSPNSSARSTRCRAGVAARDQGDEDRR